MAGLGFSGGGGTHVDELFFSEGARKKLAQSLKVCKNRFGILKFRKSGFWCKRRLSAKFETK